MKNQYEITAMFANDLGKAFEFVRQEIREACIEIVKTEAGEHASVRQRMIDRIRKVGPIE